MKRSLIIFAVGLALLLAGWFLFRGDPVPCVSALPWVCPG